MAKEEACFNLDWVCLAIGERGPSQNKGKAVPSRESGWHTNAVAGGCREAGERSRGTTRHLGPTTPANTVIATHGMHEVGGIRLNTSNTDATSNERALSDVVASIMKYRRRKASPTANRLTAQAVEFVVNPFLPVNNRRDQRTVWRIVQS